MTVRQIVIGLGPEVGQYLQGSAQQLSTDHIRELFDRQRNRLARERVQQHCQIVAALDRLCDWNDFDARR